MLRHKKHLAVAIAAAALAALAASTALAAGSYKDATGDGKGAPDIQTVSVASDANGQVVFTIAMDSLPTTEGVRAFVFLDTDANAATGDTDLLGADYAFVLVPAEHAYGFLRWNGSDWDDTSAATVSVRRSSTAYTISVNRSELGNTAGLNFWVRTMSGDPSAGQFDDAPDDGVWNYTLAANGPDITAALVQPTPPLPKAGKLFTLSVTGLKVTGETDGSAALPKPDSYTCTATVAGKRVQGLGTNGCSWKLPKKHVKGKLLAVTVNVVYEGATKAFTFSFPVG
jgi:hypothetical protein